jgi:hypothetical protein
MTHVWVFRLPDIEEGGRTHQDGSRHMLSDHNVGIVRVLHPVSDRGP